MNEKESRLGMISYHFEDSFFYWFQPPRGCKGMYLFGLFEHSKYSFTTFVLGRDEQEIIAPENDFFHNIHDWL